MLFFFSFSLLPFIFLCISLLFISMAEHASSFLLALLLYHQSILSQHLFLLHHQVRHLLDHLIFLDNTQSHLSILLFQEDKFLVKASLHFVNLSFDLLLSSRLGYDLHVQFLHLMSLSQSVYMLLPSIFLSSFLRNSVQHSFWYKR